MNEANIIALFRDAAMAHMSVEWFDYGTVEFLFDNQRDLEFPAVFLQHTGASGDDVRTTQNFTLYSMVSNPTEVEIDNTAYEYDTRDVNARQTARQILDDIIGEVKLKNLQNFILTVSAYVLEDAALRGDGTLAWRADISINHDTPINNANFPRRP